LRIQILTQEDAFYIPRILDLLFEKRRDIVGVTLVPGELQPGHLGRFLRMMGPRDFALQALGVLRYWLLDWLGRTSRCRTRHSVRAAARRAGVPVDVAPRVNARRVPAHSLRERGVDLIVSVACPQKLGRELLSVPARGAINLHGALLPRYQGIFPSFWVLAKGEVETGVTVHWMDEQLDHGDILLQRTVSIEPTDTVHRLVLRSKVDVGRHALLDALESIERGDAPRTAMDMARASYFTYPDAAAVRESFGRAAGGSSSP
jgi:methionyl-tRNA formyltransferase